MRSDPVLVVGLDGGTMDVIGPLARGDMMPTFARLMASGRTGTLRSTVPWYTVPGWASLMTGVTPATHGLMHWVASAEDEYFEGWRPGRRFVTSSEIAQPTFWDVAGAANKRVVVVNMPLTYPAWPINGAMITGLLTPQGAKQGACHPPELLDRFPGYRVDLSKGDALEGPNGAHLDETDLRSFLLQLVEITEGRAGVGTTLLRDDVDVGVVVFVGPDRISHKAWSEQAAVARGESSHGPIEELIERYYRTLDQAVGELVEAMGPDATVVIVSDHGFGAPPEHRLRVNAWLQEAGYLRLRAPRAQRMVASSPRMRRAVRKIVRRLKRSRIHMPGQALVDWSDSQVYAVAYSSTATFGLVVNRVGLKREGSVRPEDVPTILARLKEDLSSLVDDHGDRVVRRIWDREELAATTPGFPDLIVEVDPRFLPDDGLLSAGVFEPYAEPSGLHERNGAFIVSGPRVLGEGPIDADIVDVAPSVLGLLGIAAPSTMEGKARSDLLDFPPLASPPERVVGPGGREAQMTDAEEQEIEAHLRSLGYEE
jgi:predicted AlkP superfamily phosphohydrolase/phosphomutase